MRYEKGHKETTHRHILETASARFRRDGVENVGVSEIMAEAGLTHGGFYSHFASKADLVREAVNDASRLSRERFAKRIDEGGLEHWIRFYLRDAHRDHPESGCVAAALVAELARQPESTRATFTDNFHRLFSDIEGHLPPGTPPKRRRQLAIGIFSTVMGALQLARAAGDSALSEEILEGGIASALALAQAPAAEKEPS